MRWHLRQKKGNKDNKFRHGLRGLHGFKRCIWQKPCNPRNPCLKNMLFPCLIANFLLIFQYICRLAVQYFADSLQRREKRIALAFPVFNIERLAGVISIFSASLAQRYFSARHHDVKVYYNCHNFIFSVWVKWSVPVLLSFSVR